MPGFPPPVRVVAHLLLPYHCLESLKGYDCYALNEWMLAVLLITSSLCHPKGSRFSTRCP